ncbi:MAG: ubiquinol-cytochrome C chaperone family protein, partial [Sphingomonas sp.]
MSLISRIFGAPARETLDPLYRAIVTAGRDPSWYRDTGVPDTVDGRFDMIAALVAMVLLRLEAEGDAGRQSSVLLTELFVDDMDSSLREIGIGDYVVGKHVGRMMGALGGRLAALRAAGDQAALADVVERNVFRGDPPSS